jgi:hypothetical protein
VVSAGSGQPIGRAIVRARSRSGANATATTDAHGRYTLAGLPTGPHLVSASRPGYAALQYGQRHPGDGAERVLVSAGRSATGIDFALPRAGVIAGAVDDEQGEAVAGAVVRALRPELARGRRVLRPAATAATNDLGEYRLFGLAPGAYLVEALPGADPTLDEPARRGTLASTFFPAAPTPAAAEPVPVTAGATRWNVSIRLAHLLAASLLGQVVGDDGRPARAQVTIQPAEDGTWIDEGRVMTARTDAEGRFNVDGLAPGRYVVQAVSSGGRGTSTAVGLAEVALGEGPNEVVVLLGPGQRVRGRLDWRDGRPAGVGRLAVVALPLDRGGTTGSGPATVSADGAFEIDGLLGRYALTVTGLPHPWRVRSVTVGSEDVTDSGLWCGDEGMPRPVVVAVSDRAASLSLFVVDRRGRPGPEGMVLVFPTEPDRWGARLPHRFRLEQIPDTGRLELGGLPPGPYFIAARPSIDAFQAADADFLTAIAREASRVALPASGTIAARVVVTVP